MTILIHLSLYRCTTNHVLVLRPLLILDPLRLKENVCKLANACTLTTCSMKCNVCLVFFHK